ncbi:hypothetical protein ABVT39_001488 [Epinephelus coioides]
MLRKEEDTMGMEAEAEAEGATITTAKVVGEDMREEVEVDMETGEVEEEAAAEGERCRVAGEMEVEEGEAVTTRDTIKMQEGEVAMEEVTIKEASRTLATMEEEEEEEEEVVVVTMTVITKMEAGILREVGVEEVVGAGEEEAEEEADKGEAGEGEEARISTKEDRLNSSSNMAGSTTTKRALIKADTTLVEDIVRCIAAESTQRSTPSHV